MSTTTAPLSKKDFQTDQEVRWCPGCGDYAILSAVQAICQDIPDVVPAGDPDGDLLIVAWGSTYGSVTAAVRAQRDNGHRIGHVHLRHLNPLARNLGEVMGRYRQVLVPEMNLGQLLMLLRAKYLVDAQGYNKIQGQPFKQSEIEAKIEELLG